MKKILIPACAIIGLFTACDPAIDDIVTPSTDVTAEQLANGFTYVQYSDEECTTQAADGNFLKFETSPSRVVEIYQLDDEGNKNVLKSGVASGVFKLAPKRGGSPSQTFYVTTLNWDGTYLTFDVTANVFVPTELAPEMRLLASDAYGKKVWKWDTSWRADGGAWGNKAYTNGGPADDFVNNGGGIWWGCPPADLVGQLGHSDTGVATGEEHPDAYMEFYDDGNIITYDAAGNQIRKGKYSVTGYTGERNSVAQDGTENWSLGTLTTTEGTILFPFQINGGGYKPTDFEILQLDANHLKLIYAKAGAGSWDEATWWAFKSESDAEASLTNFSAKSWTWDTEFRADGAVWGNKAYTNAASGSDFAINGGGVWWGCPPADLTGQLGHSDTGAATGEEDPNAYMTFDWKAGTVTSYDAGGNAIRSGKFEITNWGNGERTQNGLDGTTDWALGTLNTDAGSILFPFQINGGGNKPTAFEILQLDGDHMKLVYGTPEAGSWGEATWWAFKKK